MSIAKFRTQTEARQWLSVRLSRYSAAERNSLIGEAEKIFGYPFTAGDKNKILGGTCPSTTGKSTALRTAIEAAPPVAAPAASATTHRLPLPPLRATRAMATDVSDSQIREEQRALAGALASCPDGALTIAQRRACREQIMRSDYRFAKPAERTRILSEIQAALSLVASKSKSG